MVEEDAKEINVVLKSIQTKRVQGKQIQGEPCAILHV